MINSGPLRYDLFLLNKYYSCMKGIIIDLPFSDCIVGLLFVILGQCPCGGQRGQFESC